MYWKKYIHILLITFSKQILKNLDLYDEHDDQENNDNDAGDSIGFTASSYAVLENENASSIMIKRTGRTDTEIKFRFEQIN